MTREELWIAYAAKNQSFLGPDATRISMTIGGLKKMFVQTWDRAHEQGVANGRALEQMKSKASDPMDTFREVFSKRK